MARKFFLDLDLAKAGLTEAAETQPRVYRIVDQSTGEQIFRLPTEATVGALPPLLDRLSSAEKLGGAG